MLGRLRDAAALEVAAEAVERTGRDVNTRVGYAILVELSDGAVIPLIGKHDLHRLLPLPDNICAGLHVRHFDVAGEPFVPMTVFVLLEAGVCDEIAVE